MDLALTRLWIANWEGRRNQTYDDKTSKPLNPGDVCLGKPTIGIGFNLAAEGAQATVELLGLDFASVVSGATQLTEDQIDLLFAGSLKLAVQGATRLVPDFDNLPDNQQMVIVDLIFNMGAAGLTGFPATLRAIHAQDWPATAAGLTDSEWFTQVGRRAKADVAVIGNTADPRTVLGIPDPTVEG